MATQAGDLFVAIPSHALRRAIRQAAFDADTPIRRIVTDTPIRRIVTDMLIHGLEARGYHVDDELIYREGRKRHAILTDEPTRPAKAAATITREPVQA